MSALTGAPRWAEAYVGIPFDRRRARGQDCWGLVRRVLKDMRGLELPHYDDVDPHDARAVARAMGGQVRVPHERVPLDALEAFDVVLMQGYVDRGGGATRAPLHVGVMVSCTHLLHVEAATPAAIVPLAHPSVAGRLVAAFRYREGA